MPEVNLAAPGNSTACRFTVSDSLIIPAVATDADETMLMGNMARSVVDECGGEGGGDDDTNVLIDRR